MDRDNADDRGLLMFALACSSRVREAHLLGRFEVTELRRNEAYSREEHSAKSPRSVAAAQGQIDPDNVNLCDL